ncbi:MAG TPA: AIR synthase related protein, partial [Saprospiraceae bacterium]|nr:AIR synthase related protein [Saprospiraceae bacterium]
PVYQREFQKPAYMEQVARFKSADVPFPKNYFETANKLFNSPNIVSKRWIYEQYDSMVRTNTTTTNKPSDAAVVRVKGTTKALAMTTDCNSAYVFANPYVGAMIAVAEAARNIVCSGGEPVAITNCLNFGNPYNPEVYWQFVEAIKGMGDACRKFGTPVTGGNVSFYNQSVLKDKTEPVYPTPTIGMLGVLESPNAQMTLDFKNAGDHIYLIGNPTNDLGSSEYLRVIHGVEYSNAPVFDLNEEYDLQQQIKGLIKQKWAESVHDVSEGGLFVALMECAMVRNLGFKIETNDAFRKDAFLFGESQSRYVVSVREEKEESFLNFLNSGNVSFTKLGEVFGKNVLIDDENWGEVERWKSIYDNRLGEILEQ